MKDEKKMTEFATLKPKTCSNLADSNSKIEKTKSTKKRAIKWELKFKENKYCTEENQLEKVLY